MHLVNFTVNLVSNKKDKRVPIAVAGQVLVDMQDLFMHVGEYLVVKELRVQSVLYEKYEDKFRIFMDENGGITFNASTDLPETSGLGNIVDETISFMEMTMDKMSSGIGGFWMEDNYNDAIYRNMVIYDLVALQQDIGDDYSLMYGSTSELKKFGKIDIDKLSSFISSKGLTCNSAVVGLLKMRSSKSGKHSKYLLSNGETVARVVFTDNNEEKKAIEYESQNVPVIIAGTLTYTEDGDLSSIQNAGGLTPISTIKFKRIISSTGDVVLKEPLTVNVSYKDEKWVLSNIDLGMSEKGDTWDDAVQSFHDYFIFLWTQYAEGGDENLSEEEHEVKRYLLGLIA